MGVEFATAAVHNTFYFHKYDNVITEPERVGGNLEKLAHRLLQTRRPKNWFRAWFNMGLANYVRGGPRLLPCGVGNDVFFVDPFGEVRPCNAMDESMGSLKERPFAEIWASPEAAAVRSHVAACDAELLDDRLGVAGDEARAARAGDLGRAREADGLSPSRLTRPTLRILVANKFWYHRGGLERVMFDEISWLEEAGHEVAHFSTQHPQNVPSPWSDYFVPYLELGEGGNLRAAQKLRAAARMFYSREAAARFTRLLLEFRPDVIHVHGIHRQLSPSVLVAAHARGIPVIQTMHDYHAFCCADVLLRGDGPSASLPCAICRLPGPACVTAACAAASPRARSRRPSPSAATRCCATSSSSPGS